MAQLLSKALGFQLLGLTMKGFVRMSCFHPTLFAPVSFADTCWQAKAGTLVRSEKTCVSEGESPSSLEARLPEFRTKVMDGKV
jgi:predicted molibdopterin-dependent oxidoreductase YjgC